MNTNNKMSELLQLNRELKIEEAKDSDSELAWDLRDKIADLEEEINAEAEAEYGHYE
jgi:F0F1-type ATP synthase membrane subunit b/b'